MELAARIGRATSVLALILVAVHCEATAPVTVFVSPTGSDLSNGTDPARPLRTLVAARDGLRKLRHNSTSDTARVVLLAGRYELTTTLELTSLDSNTAWIGNTTSDPGSNEEVLISGGVVVQWNDNKINNAHYKHDTRAVAARERDTDCQLLVASNIDPPVSENAATIGFPQLYVGTNRAPVSRMPENALLEHDAYFQWHAASEPSNQAFGYNASEVDPSVWGHGNQADLEDITIRVFVAPWTAEPVRVETVNTSNAEVTLKTPAQTVLDESAFLGVKRWVALNTPIATVVSAAPGAYRYNSTSRTVTYNYCTQSTDNDLPEAFVPVPGLATLIRLTSGAKEVSFQGVKFAHTATGAVPSNFRFEHMLFVFCCFSSPCRRRRCWRQKRNHLLLHDAQLACTLVLLQLLWHSYGPSSTGAVEVGPNASAVLFQDVAFAGTGNNALQVMHQVRLRVVLTNK